MIRVLYKIGRVPLIIVALTINSDGLGVALQRRKKAIKAPSSVKKSAVQKRVAKKGVVAHVANPTDTPQTDTTKKVAIDSTPKLNPNPEKSVQLSNTNKASFLSRNKYSILAGAAGLSLVGLAYYKGLFSKKAGAAALSLAANKPKKEDGSFLDKKLFDMKVSWEEAKEIAIESWAAAKNDITNWWNHLKKPELVSISSPDISTTNDKNADNPSWLAQWLIKSDARNWLFPFYESPHSLTQTK